MVGYEQPSHETDKHILNQSNLNIQSQYVIIYIYLYICSPPPPPNLCFDIAVRETRQTQQKHVRAILSVKRNPVMVLGLLTGTGKSYNCQGMVDRNYKVVFICPTGCTKY